MDITAMRAFIDRRKMGGIGAQDINELVAKAGTTPAAIEQMKTLLTGEFKDYFSDAGKATFKVYAAPKSGVAGNAVAVRAGHLDVPKGWTSQSLEKAKQALIEDGETASLRLPSGALSVEDSEAAIKLIEKGYFKLYKEGYKDDDGEGRMVTFYNYHLVPTPRAAITMNELDGFARRANTLTDRLTKKLDKLFDLQHARNVNSFSTSTAGFDLAKVKKAVMDYLPTAKQAIIDFEDASEKFARDSQRLDYPDSDIDLASLAKRALDTVAPKSNSSNMRDLSKVKDLIRATELLLSRPEIQAIDTQDLRIQVDTLTLVDHGGSFPALRAEVKKILEGALITGDFDLQNNSSDWDIMARVNGFIDKKLGKTDVVQQWGEGNDAVTLSIKPEHFASMTPALKAEVEAMCRAYGHPHRDDMKVTFEKGW